MVDATGRQLEIFILTPLRPPLPKTPLLTVQVRSELRLRPATRESVPDRSTYLFYSLIDSVF